MLNNVCKTEESLRRLKNRNQTVNEDTGGQQGSGDTISDEKKIREQIKLDINYFVATVSGGNCGGGWFLCFLFRFSCRKHSIMHPRSI